ncbi:UvrD-helicase domain-containing protein [Advenella mimigardefordensis]|uniref:DNA 3'-5' helicase n=1 Tax=Advenella mimigardefordensis (strain DSM 17166 / LMG 22922 / DPN7) TaxID=1247726 RepID=W0PBL9_ADVMD|nr:UvrD-helicase domain-containing protein [Advenella mimigardefordensis]AHG64249.1 putative helicase IV [Advenella mimigardefordensis DPN7]
MQPLNTTSNEVTTSNDNPDECLARYADLFDSIERTPLTQEQRRACVSDAPATLVLAGAGTGKTSTLTGRVAFLIAHGLARPADILCLAFAREAALEIDDRLQRRLAARWPIQGFTASTFHSLGLRIVREVEGNQPVLTELCSNPQALTGFIHEQMLQLATNSADYAGLLFEYFAIVEPDLVLACEFTKRTHYLSACSAGLLQTLRGEVVRNPFDCLVANALCLMGVEYDYRKHYPHSVFLARRRPYRSTFYLRNTAVYIDVFDCARPADEQCAAAVLSHRLAGIHQTYGTRHIILWEEPGYVFDIWQLIERLNRLLWECDEPAQISAVDKTSCRTGNGQSQSNSYQNTQWQQSRYRACLQGLFDSARWSSLVEMLATVLPLYRQFRSLAVANTEPAELKTPCQRRRLSVITKLMQPLASAYQARLDTHGDIDFDEMIARATQYVATGRFMVPWRDILIDEFQDISSPRFALIAAMLRQRPDLRLFCVGDDWQAIYRFAGSEIRYSTQFAEQVHPLARIVPLSRTFRFNQALCQVSSGFLMKNPSQNRKQLFATNNDKPHVITVARQQDGLAVILSRLQQAQSTQKSAVLILARFAHLLPDSHKLNAYARHYPGLRISASTVHASKGLEADYVLILNMAAGTYGFPPGRQADPVIESFLPQPERFEHADERRLFYVALTRARKHVWLLVPQDRKNMSVFVQELLRDNKVAVRRPGAVAASIVGWWNAMGQSAVAGVSRCIAVKRACRSRNAWCPWAGSAVLADGQKRPRAGVIDKIKRYIKGLGIRAEKKNRVV